MHCQTAVKIIALCTISALTLAAIGALSGTIGGLIIHALSGHHAFIGESAYACAAGSFIVGAVTFGIFALKRNSENPSPNNESLSIRRELTGVYDYIKNNKTIGLYLKFLAYGVPMVGAAALGGMMTRNLPADADEHTYIGDIIINMIPGYISVVAMCLMVNIVLAVCNKKSESDRERAEQLLTPLNEITTDQPATTVNPPPSMRG